MTHGRFVALWKRRDPAGRDIVSRARDGDRGLGVSSAAK